LIIDTYVKVDSLLVDGHLWMECAHPEEGLYGAGVEGVAELVQNLLQLAQQLHHPRTKHVPDFNRAYIIGRRTILRIIRALLNMYRYLILTGTGTGI
jgi:hypothetical protein